MRHNSHGGAPEVPIDPNATYEKRDVSIATLLPWVFMLFVFVAVAAGATYVVFTLYVPARAERTTEFPLPTVRARPTDPALQANPILDIKTMRQRDELSLHGKTAYGRDPATGDLHIPVDRAMDLVSQEGLPTRSRPGTMDPMEPDEPSHAEGQATPNGSSASQTESAPATNSIPVGAVVAPPQQIMPANNAASPPSGSPFSSGNPTPNSQPAPNGLSGTTPR